MQYRRLIYKTHDQSGSLRASHGHAQHPYALRIVTDKSASLISNTAEKARHIDDADMHMHKARERNLSSETDVSTCVARPDLGEPSPPLRLSLNAHGPKHFNLGLSSSTRLIWTGRPRRRPEANSSDVSSTDTHRPAHRTHNLNIRTCILSSW